MITRQIGQHTFCNANYTWCNIPFMWCDVPILQTFLTGDSSGDIIKKYEKLEPKKKDRIIRLICYINDVKYDDRKIVEDDIEIMVKSINHLVNESKKIKIHLNIK